MYYNDNYVYSNIFPYHGNTVLYTVFFYCRYALLLVWVVKKFIKCHLYLFCYKWCRLYYSLLDILECIIIIIKDQFH